VKSVVFHLGRDYSPPHTHTHKPLTRHSQAKQVYCLYDSLCIFQLFFTQKDIKR
jgi:hypothetical protein